ncbi:MAG: hypothetical protein ACFFD2_20255 [Promethearchaeota archaeon]
MEEQPIKSGRGYSELCCIILAVLIAVSQYYIYGMIDPVSIYFVIFVVFIILLSMYNRLSLRRKVYSHLLNFSNNRVPIQNIMTDLQLGFYDVMYILEEIQNKKKLPIEIIEKTGEVVVGKINEKIKSIPTAKPEITLKSAIKDEDIEKEGIKEGKMKYKCSSCGREMEQAYRYCPGCGRPLKKID